MKPASGFHRTESGQAAVLGLLILLVFLALAALLVDGYALAEARNWGYQAAQQAALVGASAGREWDSFEDGCIELDADRAYAAALEVLESELARRGLSDYAYEVCVLPGASGGSQPGFPSQAVRLGEGRGEWKMDEPAVGVFLSFSMQTFLLSFLGRSSVPIAVFASASVAQPEGVCLP